MEMILQSQTFCWRNVNGLLYCTDTQEFLWIHDKNWNHLLSCGRRMSSCRGFRLVEIMILITSTHLKLKTKKMALFNVRSWRKLLYCCMHWIHLYLLNYVPYWCFRNFQNKRDQPYSTNSRVILVGSVELIGKFFRSNYYSII